MCREPQHHGKGDREFRTPDRDRQHDRGPYRLARWRNSQSRRRDHRGYDDLAQYRRCRLGLRRDIEHVYGTLRLERSTLDRNEGEYGGGIANYGVLNAINSTINSGDGHFLAGGITSYG